MKKIKLSFLCLFLAISLGTNAQNYTEKTVFKNNDVEFRQIDKHTWHGNGHLCYNESVYLIEGDSAAILIDAGSNIPGLRKIAEDIVKKPVSLILTHLHGDHAGTAIFEWEDIWFNIADEAMLPPNAVFPGKKHYLVDGQTIDLGGRIIEVVFTPGHTPGSTTFIDTTNHYGFSGDAFGSTNLLVFTDLSTVIASNTRMERFIRKYGIKYFYPGHYSGDNLETPQRVKDEVTICEGVLDGTITPADNNNPSLPFVVDKYGVKINFSQDGIR